MKYQFKFKLSDADYFEFNKFYIENAAAHKGSLLNNRWLLGSACLALSLSAFYVFSVTGTLFTLIIAILALVVSAVYLVGLSRFFASIMIKSTMKKMKKDGKLPYGKDNIIQFDEDSIIEIADEAETKRKYAAVEKVVCGNQAIYIFTDAAQAYIIPLSVFETEVQRNEFLMFVNRKVEEVKHLTV